MASSTQELADNLKSAIDLLVAASEAGDRLGFVQARDKYVTAEVRFAVDIDARREALRLVDHDKDLVG